MSCSLTGIKVKVRPGTTEDIPFIAMNIREEDRAEIKASHGHSPEEALLAGLNDPLKECYTVTNLEDKPIAMFGCTKTPFPYLAGVWFLGTKEANLYLRDFLTLPPKFFQRWFEMFPNLFNIVDKRNTASLRWLRKLGFKKIAESDDWTTERTPFVMVLLSKGDS